MTRNWSGYNQIRAINIINIIVFRSINSNREWKAIHRGEREDGSMYCNLTKLDLDTLHLLYITARERLNNKSGLSVLLLNGYCKRR